MDKESGNVPYGEERLYDFAGDLESFTSGCSVYKRVQNSDSNQNGLVRLAETS